MIAKKQVILTAALLAVSVPAAAENCPLTADMPTLPPPVELTVKTAEPTVNNNIPAAVLEEKAGFIAIDHIDLGNPVQAQSYVRSVPGVGFCVTLRKIDVVWGPRAVTYGIGAEYAPGSCQYEVLKAHLDRRWHEEQKLIRDYEPKVKAAGVKAAQAVTWVVGRVDPKLAGQQLLSKLMGSYEPVFAAFNVDLKKIRERFDSADVRAAVKKKCPSW